MVTTAQVSIARPVIINFASWYYLFTKGSTSKVGINAVRFNALKEHLINHYHSYYEICGQGGHLPNGIAQRVGSIYSRGWNGVGTETRPTFAQFLPTVMQIYFQRREHRVDGIVLGKGPTFDAQGAVTDNPVITSGYADLATTSPNMLTSMRSCYHIGGNPSMDTNLGPSVPYTNTGIVKYGRNLGMFLPAGKDQLVHLSRFSVARSMRVVSYILGAGSIGTPYSLTVADWTTMPMADRTVPSLSHVIMQQITGGSATFRIMPSIVKLRNVIDHHSQAESFVASETNAISTGTDPRVASERVVFDQATAAVNVQTACKPNSTTKLGNYQYQGLTDALGDGTTGGSYGEANLFSQNVAWDVEEASCLTIYDIPMFVGQTRGAVTGDEYWGALANRTNYTSPQTSAWILETLDITYDSAVGADGPDIVPVVDFVDSMVIANAYAYRQPSIVDYVSLPAASSDPYLLVARDPASISFSMIDIAPDDFWAVGPAAAFNGDLTRGLWCPGSTYRYVVRPLPT